MASQIRKMLTELFGTPEYRLLILGFDGAGKTAILYKLKLNDFIQTIPTIGFNVETITQNRIALTMWDVGGCDKIRPLLRHYFENTKGIVFVIDSQDSCQDRQSEVKDELWRIFGEDTLVNVPVLIYLNKIDIDGGLQPDHVIKEMKLNEVRQREWFVQPCSARTGYGLYEGLDWLIRTLKSPSTACEHFSSSTKKENIASESNFEGKSLKWLSHVDNVSTEAFIETLATHKIEHFDHRILLRTIWSYLKLCGRKKAIEAVFDTIKVYVSDVNETLIYFWIQIVHYALEATKNPANTFAGFLLMNPQLLNETDLPLAYYKTETLFGDRAKRTVVLPDIKQLPNILPSSTHNKIDKILYSQEKSTNELNDNDFLNGFESCTLTSWSHKTHLRMAWLYLTRNDRRLAVNKIFDGIKRFIETSPLARKTTFHFTMTYFWIQMIDLAIAQCPKGMSFEEFLNQNSHLMNGGLFLEYYKKETLLNNPIARQEMVLPDIKPLPTMVQIGKSATAQRYN